MWRWPLGVPQAVWRARCWCRAVQLLQRPERDAMDAEEPCRLQPDMHVPQTTLEGQ
jgi:hypothetical protein